MTNRTPRADALGRSDLSRRTLLSGATALGLGLLGAACATSTPSAGPTLAASARPLPGAAGLRTVFRNAAEETTTPGAVMLYRTPDGTVTDAYGSRTTNGAPAMTVADHFRIGSVTKTLTGTVVLQLAQEGALKLDDPVSKYRDGVPNGGNITLTQLLNMHSGLYNYSEALEFNQILDTDPEHVWTPEETLALAFAHPPYFPPGSDYHYTNTGIVLLGLIVEELDGRPLGASYQKRLFGPLGMSETSFPAADSTAIPKPHPHGYMYGTNVSTMDTAALPDAEQQAVAAGTLKPNDITDNNPSWTWAAGGAISTVQDLATWVTAMGDGSLLDPLWQKKRLSNFVSTNPDVPTAPAYAMAIAKFGPLYGHTGEMPGFQAFAGYDPDTGRTLVVLANLNSTPDGRPVASTIAQDLTTEAYT